MAGITRPVIAVPTSTGYGASLEGITALLAMHASCAAGVTVVNIDSGFSAAMAVHRGTSRPPHAWRAVSAMASPTLAATVEAAGFADTTVQVGAFRSGRLNSERG